MRKNSILSLFFAFACGGSQAEPQEPKPLSASTHLQEARRCETEAAEHDSMIQPETAAAQQELVCTDQVLSDQSTSGGERLELRRPCWSAVLADNERHRRAAARLRKQAQAHREAASGLFDTEKQSCGGLGENEISASPFYYAQDILKVEELREGADVRGARVLFRSVPGLDREHLRKLIACHQARAAVMGFADNFQPYDPLALQSVATQVEQSPEGFWVSLRSPREDIALAVLGRARDCAR